jgi:hypothetical protein
MEMEMDICWWVSSSTWKKEEREKKTEMIKAKVYDRFLFCTQDTIEGVSDLESIAIL